MNNTSFLAAKAKIISPRLAQLSTPAKNELLARIAEALGKNTSQILKENEKDIKAGKRKGMPDSLLDRLLLTESRIKSMADETRKVAELKDHVGEIIESRMQENELYLKRVRVPIGVVGMIYEARPNVTVDATALCLKSGNAVVLKGGSDALNTNKILVKIIKSALEELSDAVQLIESTDRKATAELLAQHEFVDVIIPRGSRSLINFVRENSLIPVIETGASVVHTYVHSDADLEKAVKIVMNAKLRRVSICNTLDSLVLHKDIAQKFLQQFVTFLPVNGYKATRLEFRADARAFSILNNIKQPKSDKFKMTLKKAGADDFHTEFLDYILAVKVVNGLDEALEHIAVHSLKHSEAIITEDRKTAERFLAEVDAACVYWNASTQFSDGAQFGLGAEIGISTQKLHVRGPFALEGLTSYKWVIEGDGQVRRP
jgi:glutamate-5-semialdehyde dehydrogenase